MKILIAYDGSGTALTMLSDLRLAGLPERIDAFIISIAEMYLSPKNISDDLTQNDENITDYFQKHSDQMERNLAKTKEILFQAKTDLQKYFPEWNIETTAKLSYSAADEILLKASEFDPDLIAIGSQGLSWDGIRRLGSISQKVLTESECSLRIARTKRDSNSQNLKIAICFDGSNDSIEAVKAVASRQWSETPEIRLLTVTDPLNALIPGRAFQVIPGLPEGKMKGEIKWIESLAADARRILLNAGFTASLHIYSGNPRLVLVNETDDWGADLIFIGANSNLSETYLPGSVAIALTVRASCTVEVVRI